MRLFYVIVSIFLLHLLPSTSQSENGVCPISKRVQKTKQVPYTVTAKCKTKLCKNATKITRYRILRYFDVVQLHNCCPGYTAEGGTCVPKCDPPCVNGDCSQPNICSCHRGFAKDPAATAAAAAGHLCAPVCGAPCTNGECIAPDTCACRPGYAPDPVDTHNCHPVCGGACTNGRCIAPNTCSCNSGFAPDPTDRNTCAPQCNRACVNGRCVGNDTCACAPGFAPHPSDRYGCVPVCTRSCINAICTAPDKCQCLGGFRRHPDHRHECVPVCSADCVHGRCVAPDVCACLPGYGRAARHRCRPVCSQPCVNAVCAAPERCACEVGHVPAADNPSYRCRPACPGGCVNGNCTAPNVCSCHAGFRKDPNDAFLCRKICEKCANEQECDDTHFEDKECAPGCEDGFEFIDGQCEPSVNGKAAPNVHMSSLFGLPLLTVTKGIFLLLIGVVLIFSAVIAVIVKRNGCGTPNQPLYTDGNLMRSSIFIVDPIVTAEGVMMMGLSSRTNKN